MKILKELIKSKKYENIYNKTLIKIIKSIKEKYPKYKNKEIIKLVKKKIYNIHLKFFNMFDYEKLFNKIKPFYEENNKEKIKKLNLKLLKKYDSNRAQSINEFYNKIFEITEVPKKIIDIGCGLNFLTLPWIKNNEKIKYIGYDINKQEINFLNKVFKIINKNYKAILQDCLIKPPKIKGDISFLLKTTTCFEWQDKKSVLNLINKLRTKWIVISLMMRGELNEKGCDNYFEKLLKNIIKNKKTHKIILKKEYIFIIKNY